MSTHNGKLVHIDEKALVIVAGAMCHASADAAKAAEEIMRIICEDTPESGYIATSIGDLMIAALVSSLQLANIVGTWFPDLVVTAKDIVRSDVDDE